MDKNSNTFTVVFATVVCVILAVALASTYNGLKGRMDSNALFDKHRNVLIALGLHEASTPRSRTELDELFEKRVVREVLEVQRREVTEEVMHGGDVTKEKVERVTGLQPIEGKTPAQLDALLKEAAGKPKAERQYVALYRGLDESGKTTAYCIPIEGYGLWSTLYGFLALDKDLDTVRGITFYKHGETPGLGGEVDNVAWQKSWRGKTILDDRGHLVSITLKKGAVNPAIPQEKQHMVDGLSGATITSNGVTRFVAEDLTTYEPYFEKLRTK